MIKIPEPLGRPYAPFEAPPDQAGWGGRLDPFKLPGFANQVGSVLEARRFDSPQALTVQLGRSTEVAAATNLNADVRARIFYGSGNAGNSFFCDWADGTLLTFVGSTCAVDWISFAPTAGLPYLAESGGLSDTLRLIANLSVGSRASDQGPIFSIQQTLNAGLTSTPLRVPQFARSVEILIAEAAAPGFTTDFYAAGTVNYALQNRNANFVIQQTVTSPGPFPLRLDTDSVLLQNTDAVGIRITLNFRLQL